VRPELAVSRHSSLSRTRSADTHAARPPRRPQIPASPQPRAASSSSDRERSSQIPSEGAATAGPPLLRHSIVKRGPLSSEVIAIRHDTTCGACSLTKYRRGRTQKKVETPGAGARSAPGVIPGPGTKNRTEVAPTLPQSRTGRWRGRSRRHHSPHRAVLDPITVSPPALFRRNREMIFGGDTRREKRGSDQCKSS
jgi:hypothetical protein